MLLVGHVTKDGALAGPRVLEHLVDCVLQFEGERERTYRTVRAIKNRFGSTNEAGVFEMRDDGLVEVLDASARFVGEATRAPGSVVLCAIEGSRPLLVEVQALVSTSELVPPETRRAGQHPPPSTGHDQHPPTRTPTSRMINLGYVALRQDATAAACRLPVCPATMKERVSGDVADFGVFVGHAGMPCSGYRDLDDPTARGRGRPEGDTALRLAPKSLCSWGSQNPEVRA